LYINKKNKENMMRTVIVLGGGLSHERDISLMTAQAVMHALQNLNYPALMIDPAFGNPGALLAQFSNFNPDHHVIFNALHGHYGEDGRLQGFLECLGLPYTHASCAASAIGFNKALTKSMVHGLCDGLFLPKGEVFFQAQDFLTHLDIYPCVIKPLASGSSERSFFLPHHDFALELFSTDWPYDAGALVEDYIEGKELTIGIFGNKALEVLEIEFENSIQSFDIKYRSKKKSWHLPARIPQALRYKIQDWSLAIHRHLGCAPISRLDFRCRGDEVFFLEINTHPGMTTGSFLPHLCAFEGITFEALVVFLIEQALECHALKSKALGRCFP
jgi:D-alanine-D-alanine ligase